MRLTSKTIVAAQDKVKSTKIKEEQVTLKVVLDCKHKDLAECEYQPSDWGPAYAPLRMCLNCGLAEVGWGCGYKVLTTDSLIKKIDRDMVYRLRTYTINDDHKSLLIRKEKTLAEIIQEELGLPAHPLRGN
jgi:hypothetical protein